MWINKVSKHANLIVSCATLLGVNGILTGSGLFDTIKIMNCVSLFVLRLNAPVNNFSVMSGRSHCFLGN